MQRKGIGGLHGAFLGGMDGARIAPWVTCWPASAIRIVAAVRRNGCRQGHLVWVVINGHEDICDTTIFSSVLANVQAGHRACTGPTCGSRDPGSGTWICNLDPA